MSADDEARFKDAREPSRLMGSTANHDDLYESYFAAVVKDMTSRGWLQSKHQFHFRLDGEWVWSRNAVQDVRLLEKL